MYVHETDVKRSKTLMYYAHIFSLSITTYILALSYALFYVK